MVCCVLRECGAVWTDIRFPACITVYYLIYYLHVKHRLPVFKNVPMDECYIPAWTFNTLTSATRRAHSSKGLLFDSGSCTAPTNMVVVVDRFFFKCPPTEEKTDNNFSTITARWNSFEIVNGEF